MKPLIHLKSQLPDELRFGYDVFISYSRKDSTDYAIKLYECLARERLDKPKKLSPFMDAVATEPSADVPPSVLRTLRRCSLLVVIGSPCAVKSKAIQKEIEIFLPTRRHIVIVDINEVVDHANWNKLVEGLPLTEESIDALNAA